MKVIATTVGVSLYENYLKGNGDIKEHYQSLKEERYSSYDSRRERISKLKLAVKDFIKEKGQEASAETKSIAKIHKKLGEPIEVRLIATDTILSAVAAELLSETGCGVGVETHFNPSRDVINGLQVADAAYYREDGSRGLFRHLYQLNDECGGNMAINMTGGFKATIPLLTIFGQINGISIYYIFENTDALIEIPQAPIDIDWSVFDAHAGLFSRLDKEDVIELPEKDMTKKHPELEALLEVSGEYLSLNALGTILWLRYKAKRETVYFSERAREGLDELSDKDKLALFKSLSVLKKKLLENSDDPSLKHPLKDIELPAGYYCYKTVAEGKQARIVWSKNNWVTKYRTTEIDLYIASFYMGSEVHNADTEYVNKLRSLLKSDDGRTFDKGQFDLVTFGKSGRSVSLEVGNV